jgi:hypothetical protein
MEKETNKEPTTIVSLHDHATQSALLRALIGIDNSGFLSLAVLRSSPFIE